MSFLIGRGGENITAGRLALGVRFSTPGPGSLWGSGVDCPLCPCFTGQKRRLSMVARKLLKASSPGHDNGGAPPAAMEKPFMRPLTTEPTPEELDRTFDRLKEQLSPQVLDEVINYGLRDSMINEYKELAETTSSLISLLRSTGVANILLGRAVEDYEQILAKLAMSGQRFRLLIDESSAVDEMALLAIAGDDYSTIN